MRTLASIQKVLSVEPIVGADMIEKVTIQGWECVTQKSNKFKVGDLVVYFEIDSILPEIPMFEFLRSRKFRIRTIKLKGQVSQGLVMPIDILPNHVKIEENIDVTVTLGVVKYDPELIEENKLIQKQVLKSRNWFEKAIMRNFTLRRLLFPAPTAPFPSFIHKSDETRIQNMPFVLNSKDKLFYSREKLNGTSGTYFMIKNSRKWMFWKKYIFGVCSRNIWLRKPDNSYYWRIAIQDDIENVLKELIGKNEFVALQGEIIGSGIQDNQYGYEKGKIGFFAFNLVFPNNKTNTDVMEKILMEHFINTVPLDEADFRIPDTIQEIVEMSKGNSVFGVYDNSKGKLVFPKREGIVVRSYGNVISFKVLNPDDLLDKEKKEEKADKALEKQSHLI